MPGGWVWQEKAGGKQEAGGRERSNKRACPNGGMPHANSRGNANVAGLYTNCSHWEPPALADAAPSGAGAGAEPLAAALPACGAWPGPWLSRRSSLERWRCGGSLGGGERALKLLVDAEAGVRPAGWAYFTALAGAGTYLPRGCANFPPELPARLLLPPDGPLRSGSRSPLPMLPTLRMRGRPLPMLPVLSVRGSERLAAGLYGVLGGLAPLALRASAPAGAAPAPQVLPRTSVRPAVGLPSAREARLPLPRAPSARASRRLLPLLAPLTGLASGPWPLLHRPCSLPSAEDSGLSVAVQPPTRDRLERRPAEAGGAHSGLSTEELPERRPAATTVPGSGYGRAPPVLAGGLLPLALPLPLLPALPGRGWPGCGLPAWRGRQGLGGMEAPLLLRESARFAAPLPLPVSLQETELGGELPRGPLPPAARPFSASSGPGLAGEAAAGAVRRRRAHQ